MPDRDDNSDHHGDVVVEDVEERSRYQISVDGRTAGHAAYLDRGGRRIFVHTEIAEEFGGRGLGSRLVAYAMDDVAARELAIVPLCPFVAAWLEDHPERTDVDVDTDRLEALTRR
ncbi:GNAT family N-acetyltransferase [Euzebya tangerina]|uniref:GNAT family N-acetyltransferase n=1 Tax=Euzebya tangerina TaxID=591198 RepID=UPI000E324AA0|nr:GNAT family N-acetyltransferase [Euzebya tangerina]